MGNRHGGWTWKALGAAATTAAMLILGLGDATSPAQQVQGQGNVRGRARNAGAGAARKGRPEADDPLAAPANDRAKNANAAAKAAETYHYNFKLRSFDGTPLTASYYPSKLGNGAAVVVLIHESGRTRKDFEDPVAALKGEGLAGHLQGEGYAVLTMDLRNRGQNARGTVAERQQIIEDIQAAYQFLIDRHNRGDFNVTRLGVVGLGDGANLAAAWAYQPGAAVSTDGRASDLNALVLISPRPEGAGYILGHVIASLSSWAPLAFIGGDKDAASKDAIQSVRRLVERARLNKVDLIPSSLHGYQLLRLEPKVTTTLVRFLETSLKLRPSEWEPRYNLLPITVADIQTIHHGKAGENREKVAPKKEPEKDQPAAKPAAPAPAQAQPAPAPARDGDPAKAKSP